jgi:hypothetical protein
MQLRQRNTWRLRSLFAGSWWDTEGVCGGLRLPSPMRNRWNEVQPTEEDGQRVTLLTNALPD